MTLRRELFRVTLVCTANMCRSPFAEAALADHILTRNDLDIMSRGTQAEDGHRVPAGMLAAADDLSIDLTQHSSRALTPSDVDESNLLLALSVDHRAEIAQMSPRAVRRTFTLIEFSRLVGTLSADDLARLRCFDSSPAARLDEASRVLATRRGQTPPGVFVERRHDTLSVDDPYGQRASTYKRGPDEIMAAVRPIAALLQDVGAPTA